MAGTGLLAEGVDSPTGNGSIATLDRSMQALPVAKGTTIRDTRSSHLPKLSPRRLLFVAVALFCLTPWMTPPLALMVGVVVALAGLNPLGHVGHKLSKTLLQGCVVLLGFGMNLPVVLKAGADGALLAAGTIALTLGLGYAIGRLLKIRSGTSLLISAGTAICGGSAIAAVGSAIDADEGDMTVAMGVVFMLNAVALYLFPILGHALNMSGHPFGVWSGVAIHDLSSVVGAASHYGQDALQTATAVKLSRALWIVPVTLGVVIAASRRQAANGKIVQGQIAAGQPDDGQAANGQTAEGRFAESEVASVRSVNAHIARGQAARSQAVRGQAVMGQIDMGHCNNGQVANEQIALASKGNRKLQIPWFIGLFLLASICRSMIPAVANAAPTLTHIATAGLTLTLFLVGAGLSVRTLRAVGWKALVQGMALWLVISTASLAFILYR